MAKTKSKPITLEPEEKPVVKPQEPTKRNILRLFECLVWAEQALAAANRIGIFQDQDTHAAVHVARTKLVGIVEAYRAQWIAMQTECSDE